MKLMKLEAIRGFAAIYVVFHHSFRDKCLIGNIDFSFLFRFGQEAVIIFFVLSGFVIKYTYEISSNKTFSSYFSKRFARLYIPLFLIFPISYLFNSFNKGSLLDIDIYTLLGNFFMLQDDVTKPNVICPPYMENAPLWSLSYEWWFYMLFFPVTTWLKNKDFKKYLYAGIILAALSYIVYPFFINRVLLYFAIWWTGVEIADLYLHKKDINFTSLKNVFILLILCSSILLLNIFIGKRYFDHPTIGMSPFLELRHFLCALFVLSAMIIWKKFQWKFFDYTFGPFKYISPISYLIYISHWFLVTNANYLNYIPNQFLRFVLYLLVLFGFSYVVELKIYPFFKEMIIKRPKKYALNLK